MITFKLEDKAAEALIATLNAGNSHASFIEELNTQFFEQTVVDVIEAPVVEEPVVEEPVVAKKSKVKTEE